MKRPKKRVMGLKSITKAARTGSTVRTFHTQHAKPVRDLATGKYHCVKPDPRAARASTVRSFHTQHGKPVLDRKTGKYHTVKPRSTRPYAHVPASDRAARSGKLKQARYQHTGKPAAVPRSAPPAAPQRGTSAQARGHSSQSELYRFHKANGTLAEYYRLFGIDPT